MATPPALAGGHQVTAIPGRRRDVAAVDGDGDGDDRVRGLFRRCIRLLTGTRLMPR
jgi:hypothetical protein